MSALPLAATGPFLSAISTFTQGPARPRVPLAGDGAAHRRQIAEALNRVVSGQIACTFGATLLPTAYQTIFLDPRIGSETHASFSPTSASAARELASGAMWWTCATGQMIVRHRATDETDRTFTVSLLG